MPGGGELADPVAYAAVWAWVAALLPLVVVGWYAGATWWTRDRDVPHGPAWLRLWMTRRDHLRRLDRIEEAVAAGRMSSREGHLAVSATVRSFVAAVGDVDVRTMNLQQLRQLHRSTAAAPAALVDVVERGYPPSFAPDAPDAPDERDEELTSVLRDARALVAEWRP